MFREVVLLLKKDLVIEWRMRYAIGGIFLYVLSTVFTIYIVLSSERALQMVQYNWWSILFWITIIFTAVNAIAKSFTQENKERLLYYYTVASPQAIILSKMFYNMMLMLVLSLICLLVFSVMIAAPVQNYFVFFLALFLGGSGFSFVLTLISSIAAKADNNAALMAVLSLPVILPLIMLIQHLSGMSFFVETESLPLVKAAGVLAAFDAMVVTLSYILFPYLWRD